MVAAHSRPLGRGGNPQSLAARRARSRNPNLLANVALVRSALLHVLERHFPEQSLPEIREHLHSRPGRCLTLLATT
jgi:hypothetical protein